MIVVLGAHVYNDDISIYFFHFFKILIFLVVRRVKWQKMAQNDKKFCLSHSISQELYLIWLWFLAHWYKIMVSPAIFFIFSKFWFFRFLVEGKRAKKWPIITNFSLSHYISRTVSWRLLLHMYKLKISPGVFLYLFYYFFYFCKYKILT